MIKNDIKSMTMKELEEFVVGLGEKAFRAKQLFDWLHQKLENDFNNMTNLSTSFRKKLEDNAVIYSCKLMQQITSQIDGTTKFIFQLHDKNIIESVCMRYKHGNSLCISSQVGCKMGCKFCASTLKGLNRNLTASEMLSQIYEAQKLIGERISNIVVMGIGEPLDNYDNLISFLRKISDPNGLNISQRNITVSTCGLVDQIIRLAEEKLQITLAISLHAPDDEKRRAIMPISYKYKINEILDACKIYYKATGRRITFEYGLIAGVNDSVEDSQKLMKLLKYMNCHVNLIPINPIKERVYERSTMESVLKFKQTLEKSGINATVRREMGQDIEAACGQLRKDYLDAQEDSVH